MKSILRFVLPSAIVLIASAVHAQESHSSPIAALENNVHLTNAMLGGGDKGCGSCGKGSCCCAAGGFFAGVEATYLTLEPTQNFALFDDGDGGQIMQGSPDDRFDYNFEAAPRIWLGYQGANGWGIRGRYWQFDSESSLTDIEDLNPIDDIDAAVYNSEFEAYTIDLEVTRAFRRGNWNLLASAGARHASIAQRYIGQEYDIDDGDVDDLDSLGLQRRMDGTGVTVALEGDRPIGSRNLSLFWSLRGSAVFGNNKAAALHVEVDDDDAEITAGASRTSQEMFIGDAQLGLMWSAPVEALGGAEVFFRGAFEYQIWDLQRSAAVIIPPDPDATRIDALGNGDVSAYGAAISAGIIR